jgi:hypothetical protein
MAAIWELRNSGEQAEKPSASAGLGSLCGPKQHRKYAKEFLALYRT